MTMTLRAVCDKYGLDYSRAWYALAVGRVPGPKVIGRVWSLGQRDIDALRSHLASRASARKENK
jgi:hypothetical protein